MAELYLNKGIGECTVCHFKFCFMCNEKPHPFKRCESRKIVSTNAEELKEGMDAVMDKMEKTRNAISEKKNILYLMQCSKPCPGCKMPIQRTDGCCKMHCSSCHVSFCWICLVILPNNDPYAHYQNNTKCYLFATDKEIGNIAEELKFKNPDENGDSKEVKAFEN